MSAMNQTATISKDAPITETADQSGCRVAVCCPTWFDRRKEFKVANPAKHAANLNFSGADLNFAARVLYAEATGSQVGVASSDLASEKQAILHVMYFRLNRKGYPSNAYVATSFQMVGEAPKVQFESVAKDKPKFSSTSPVNVSKLRVAECADLQACIDAVQMFLSSGPDYVKYPFDEFRDVNTRPKWHGIANTAFHLTSLGRAFLPEAAK
jgi:hypothetical protein